MIFPPAFVFSSGSPEDEPGWAGRIPLVSCFRILCVDDFPIFHIRPSSSTVATLSLATLTTLRAAIQLLGEAVRNLLQLIDGGLDRRQVLPLRRPTRLGNGRFNSSGIASRHPTAIFIDRFLDLIGE